MDLLRAVDNSQMRTDLPRFRPGDTVRVHVKIKEGDKYRIQIFEGVIIARKRNGISSTFTVRKVSSGYGIERIFPTHSPIIEKLEVIKEREGAARAALLSTGTPRQSCKIERSGKSRTYVREQLHSS